MASIGAIGQHFIRFPGFENCTGTFGAALQGAGTLGLFFLTVSLSVLELAWRDDPEKEAGNFGNQFGIEMYNDEWRTKEISNGRMAMISILDIWGAEVATGKDAIQQFGFGALPRSQVVSTASSFAGASASAITALRGKPLAATAVAEAPVAIEEATPPPPPPFNPAEQIGAMPPLGFFDPMGFTPMGDEATFRQMRAAEIKHGRVAMMASIGAIGQHFIRFPGFENCTGTFGAALQGAGTLGLFFLTVSLSVLELAWRDDPEKEAGNFGNPFGIEMYNDEWRTKEVSNGRMAMISILGIWGAEVATGKDAIQQFGFGALPRSQVVSTAS